MKHSLRLVDTCEHNNVCFSTLVSDLKRITENQAVIIELLLKILEKINRSDTILKKEG